MIRWQDDLKTALVLSLAFGLSAAVTVPVLLPILPPEARSLPLPIPVFCALLAAQLTVVYGLLGFAGLRLARRRGSEPAPYLTARWVKRADRPGLAPLLRSFAAGLVCGFFLVAAVALIQSFFPGTLPQTLHPSGLAAALVASATGSIGEEILFRLFVLSALLYLLPKKTGATLAAVLLSAIAFGAAHAPALVFLFGGFSDVPPASWVWLIALNGMLGICFGFVFLRHGILCAILAHFGTDLVWHVASQLWSS